MSMPVSLSESLSGLLDELEGDFAHVAQRMVTQVRAQMPVSARVGTHLLDHLPTVVERNLARSLRAMRGGSSPDLTRSDGETMQEAVAIGSLTGRLGLPLDEVIGAYRISGQVLWEECVDRQRRSGCVTADALLDFAGLLWSGLDRHLAVVIDSYRAESRRLEVEQVRKQRAALEQLLAGDDAAATTRSAQVLGMPHGPYRCLVVASPDDARRGHLPALPPQLTVAWTDRGATRVALVAGARPDLLALGDLRPGTGCVVVLSGILDDLNGLPSLWRVAQLAVSAPLAPGVHLLDERLPLALLAATPDVAAHLRRCTTGRLEAVPQAERALLLQTIRVMIRHQWSASAAAEELFCHRNTVLRRWVRLRQLLGEDPSEPDAALLWHLVLLAEDGPSS